MNIITLPGTIKLVETQTRQNKMSQIAIFDFPQEQEKWVLIKGKLPLIHFAHAQYSPMSTSIHIHQDLLLFKLWPI